jgi:hypothetical protein
MLALLLGVAIGVGGTLGVQAMTDEPDPPSSARESGFNSDVRDQLAEEYGDVIRGMHPVRSCS